jgi:hypothetical protein
MDRNAERQPDPALDKEQAEGSRPTVDEALEHAPDPGERSADVDPPVQVPQERAPGQGPVGISNRPRDEEEREQAELPPRFTRKAE